MSSGSPEEVVLRPDRDDVAVIPAVMALAKRGLSMLKAKRAVEAMIAEGRVILEVPVVESVEALSNDLRFAGVAARFRSVEDRLMIVGFAEHVRNLRNRLNMTQETFALSYGLDVKTVRGWEAGKTPDRGNRALVRLIERDPIMTERLMNAG